MLTLKSKFFSLSLVLVFSTLVASGFSQLTVAAENDFPDRNDPRTTQRPLLPENGVNALTTQQPRITRRQASNIASDSFEGRVLSIRLDNNNWRVRMDQDGTVFNVFVNAASGNVSAAPD